MEINFTSEDAAAILAEWARILREEGEDAATAYAIRKNAELEGGPDLKEV